MSSNPVKKVDALSEALQEFERTMLSSIDAFGVKVKKILAPDEDWPSPLPVKMPKRDLKPAVSRIKVETTTPYLIPTPMSKCEYAILCTLDAWHPLTRSATFVAIFADYSLKSGSFNAAISNLRHLGLIEGTNAALSITPNGQANAAVSLRQIVIPKGMAELTMWCEKLDSCSAMVLTYLEERDPARASAHEIAEATRYSTNSGSFNASLSKLKKLELVEGRSASLALHPDFVLRLCRKKKRS